MMINLELTGRECVEQVWDYAHGRDERQVAPSQVRKSVGAEINYAVRLDSVGDADKFVDELAGNLQASNLPSIAL